VPELIDATPLDASRTAQPSSTDDVSRLLPAIFDTMADGITVLDRAGMVRYANEAAAELIGVSSAAELIGSDASGLTGAFEMLNEDGTPLDPGALPTRKALSGEPAPEAVVRFKKPGSREDRWSVVRARLLSGPAPESDLVVTSFQDITQLKRVELRLSFLSDASAVLSDAVEQPEALGRIAAMAVPFVTDWCAIDVIDESREVHRVALAHAERDTQVIDEEPQRRWSLRSSGRMGIGHVLRTGLPLHAQEITEALLLGMAIDDSYLAGMKADAVREALIVPLAGRGRILGALTAVNLTTRPRMTHEDIEMLTELGRRAGATVDAARLMFEAQDAVRVRDEFMAIASHDMRTPLAAVRGYAQLARRHLAKGEHDVESLDRWLSDIDESADRLTGLVSEFMDISLLRGGQSVPLQRQPVDLVELVTDRVREHEGSDEQTHLFNVSSGAAEIVGTWDGARLGRVLDNVLANAVKFSASGSTIEVRIWEEHGFGCVAVADHGIGIAFRDQGLIFGPMYRAENARGVSGTGLGLAGSRSMLELMGGEITVQSRLGEGSTFTIRLPLEPEPEARGESGSARA
jgi:PAS domain S-box-containing protein